MTHLGTRRRLTLFFLLWLLLLLPLALATGWLAARLGTENLFLGTLPVLLAAVGAGGFLLHREGWSPAALGFHPHAAGMVRGLLVGTVAGASLAVLGALAAWIMGGGSLVPGHGTGSELAAGGGTLLMTLLVPAAAEEALVRGYPFQALAAGIGVTWAIWGTTAVFAVLHLANPGVGVVGIVNVALAGVLLALVVLRTGSLWWATGGHLGWNWGMAALLGMPVSGIPFEGAPLLEFRPTGPDWLSGGDFGLEGSVGATLVLALATAALWRYPGTLLEPGARRWPPLQAAPGEVGRPLSSPHVEGGS